MNQIKSMDEEFLKKNSSNFFLFNLVILNSKMPCVCLWVEDRWVISLLNLMDSLCPIADYRDDMFDITERVELVSQFFM